MSSAQSERDDLDELAELGVDEVVFRPLFSGPGRASQTVHRPAVDDPNRAACGMGEDLERGSVEDARRVGARRPCRHQTCFGEGWGGQRRRVIETCPLGCGAEDIELGRHLPECPRRHEVP